MERGKEGEKYLEHYNQGKIQCFFFYSMNPAVRKRRRKHTNLHRRPNVTVL